MEKLEDEERLILIRVISAELPYLWYSKEIGKEYTAVDSRYERMYKVLNGAGERRGYIVKTDCEIVKELQKRDVPDFPFLVRIMKNSWFPECWYAKHIGEYFEITSGGTINEWGFKSKDGTQNLF